MEERHPDTRGIVCRPAAGERMKRSALARAEAVGMFRRELAHYAARLGADESTRAAVALAVSEAVTNAVVHSYAGDQPGPVSIEAWGDDEGHLFVQVCDEGKGMVPRSDSPGLGLGLSVIAQMADDLHVASRGGGLQGTIVSMRFSLDGPPSEAAASGAG